MILLRLSLLAVVACFAAAMGVFGASEWRGPGWYQISYSLVVGEMDPLKGTLHIVKGPFRTKRECEKTLPPTEVTSELTLHEPAVQVGYWCDEENEIPLWDLHREDDGW